MTTQQPRDGPAARASRGALGALLAASLACAGAPSRRAVYILDEPDLLAEGIAWDAAQRALFVGSIMRGAIFRLPESGGARLFAGGLLPVLGVRIDAARGLLWAATNAEPGTAAAADPASSGRSELVALDLRTGAVRRKLSLSDGHKHLLNDVAVGDDGTVYVTDSEAGAVLRSAGGGGDLRTFVPAGALDYPNGIAFARGRLYVAHSPGLVIAAADGSTHAVGVAPGVDPRAIDGLYPCGDGLLGVQSAHRPPRITRFRLDGSGERIVASQLVAKDPDRLPLPTTGALDGADLLVVANSDVDALGERGLSPGSRPTTRILRFENVCA
jgi:sugar lactone lactonase YvrE